MDDNVISNHFSDYNILRTVEEGVNSTHVFQSNDNRYVFKKFTFQDFENEDYLASLKLVDEHLTNSETFRIPNIINYGVDDDKHIYLIYKWIDGTIYSNNILSDVDNWMNYIDQVTAAMLQLHKQYNPVDEFGWYILDDNDITLKNGYNESKGFVISQLKYYNEMIGNDLSESKKEEIVKTVESNLNYSGDAVVSHSDIKYDNLVLDDNKVYFLDWEYPVSADPMFDVVKAERQFARRYDTMKQYDSHDIEDLVNYYRNSYFDRSNREYNIIHYNCYWLLELVQALGVCEDWYPEDELEDVKQHYKSNINSIVENIDEKF